MDDSISEPSTQSPSHQPSEIDDRPAAKQMRLEAVLFLSRKPVNTRKLAQLAMLADGSEARAMIKRLNDHYLEVGRSFHIKRVAGGYQLMTRPQFFDWIHRLRPGEEGVRISPSAQETLTVIAYRQPIIKSDIETIRGVQCGEMLRQLLEKGMIKIAGRSEELGRPFLYATTRNFLTEFGFDNLRQLPDFENLSGSGLPDWEHEESPTQVTD